MDSIDFEGSLVLEKLAEIDKVDAFFEAIDADDFTLVAKIMRQAKIDPEIISATLKEISEIAGDS